MIDQDGIFKDQLGPHISVSKPEKDESQESSASKNDLPNPADPQVVEEIHKENLYRKDFEEDIQEPEKSLFKRLMSDYFPLYGAYLTGLGHVAAGAAYLFGTQAKEKIDSFALNLSKIVLSLNCSYQGLEAFKGKRLWEGISRILEPIFIIAEKRVEDLGLARGIGLGISQLVESQDGIREELINQKKLDSKNITMGQDHDLNFVAMKKIAGELLEGNVLGNRRFLTGFTWANIKDALKNFGKDFKISSVGELVSSQGTGRERIQRFFDSSGLSHIKKLCVGDDKLDKGHTTALSGYLMIAGSVIGYLDKATKGMLYKIGGTIRNMGGMIADVSIFGFPDVKHNMASPFLTVNGFLDIFQRFIPTEATSAIKTVGNLSMAAYNVGVGIYLDRSNDKTNKEDQITRYDTDLGKEKVSVKPRVMRASSPVVNEEMQRTAAEQLAA